MNSTSKNSTIGHLMPHWTDKELAVIESDLQEINDFYSSDELREIEVFMAIEVDPITGIENVLK